ncbi:MAG: transcription termination factor NusA [Planctomycetota bacterium]|nr:MAG: transcription termination factor NusA [Planctomycetota bacterium]
MLASARAGSKRGAWRRVVGPRGAALCRTARPLWGARTTARRRTPCAIKARECTRTNGAETVARKSELLRLVDVIQREKNIDRESVFEGLEQALLAAARKRLSDPEAVEITIDRETGEIHAFEGGRPIEPEELGRIAALTAKQVMMQKFREAERDVVYDEFESKVGEMVTGIVQRVERSHAIVSLGRAEAILPRREQPAGETYHLGERVKALIIDVRKVGQRVRIVLSRAHPDIVRNLFALEVPEIQDGVVEIKGIARDPGYRTKVAVASRDPQVDPVGACVGIRGSRIKNIVDELGGEKIDIVRFADTPEVYLMNALKPAELQGIELDYDEGKALVFVPEDQLALAIGKRGQNVRLAAKLTGWAIDIVTGTPDSYVEKFVTSRSLEEVQAERARAAEKAAAALEGKVAIPLEGSFAAATRSGTEGDKPDPFAVAARAASAPEAKSAAASALDALMANETPTGPAPWLATDDEAGAQPQEPAGDGGSETEAAGEAVQQQPQAGQQETESTTNDDAADPPVSAGAVSDADAG